MIQRALSVQILLICCVVFLVIGGTARAESISFLLSAEDAVAQARPVQWALGQLQKSLQTEGVESQVREQLKQVPANDRCIVVAGRSSNSAAMLLKQQGVTISGTPESLCLLQGTLDGRSVLLVCGSDATGLMYALTELVDRIECGVPSAEALTVAKPIIETPAIKIRSIYRTFTSDVEDLPWYNDREFWRQYLSELSKQRINRFSLTFGMGYNKPKGMKDSYLFFVYPFLLDVPGYDVRAVGLPGAERDRNLDMLKFIGKEAVARGLQFHVGLWSHGRDWKNSDEVNYPLEGLTAKNHGPYCRDALAMLLKACPTISGVTLRVHDESGVPEGEDDFWRVVFDAFKGLDRPVEIDMHGKKLLQEHLDWARATGMPVVASPKMVGEHMGLGYHPADIRYGDKGKVKAYTEPASGVHLTERRFTRAGYGDFLPKDREWGVLHRIWPGTNVLLLAGDPALAAGYGRSTKMLGTLGVERVDPLGFKGRKGSGYPGGRCAYADKSLEPTWDFQKFLYTYRVWGRLLYNPDTDPEVWRRFMRSKFGDAARPMEIALANSSRVVHLITTSHGPATDCTRFWPEMYTNQPIIKETKEAIFSDNPSPKVFGNVSPHDPQLFSKMNDFAAALLRGEELPKYSPLVVAGWLDDLADTARQNLNKAESLVADKRDVEFRRFSEDIKIQSGTAKFFADKMRAAVLWHLYKGSEDSAALVEAVKHYTKARDIWVKMAEEAKSVYVENVSFGTWETQSGHWIKRLPRIDSDIADMKEALAKAKSSGKKSERVERVQAAIRRVKTRPTLASVEVSHHPVPQFSPGKEIKILAQPNAKVQGMTLHYRHANQAVIWKSMPMEESGSKFVASIPAVYTRTRYPLLYYFTVDTGKGGKAIYPGLDENQAGMPYFIIHQ